MNNNPKGINQHSKKSKKVTAVVVTLFAVLALMVAGVFHGETLLAQVDEIMQMQEEVYVAVTAEVKLDCTSPTHMFEEECVKKVTDHLATTFSDLKKAEDILQQAQLLYDKAFDDHQQAVEQFNVYTK